MGPPPGRHSCRIQKDGARGLQPEPVHGSIHTLPHGLASDVGREGRRRPREGPRQGSTPHAAPAQSNRRLGPGPGWRRGADHGCTASPLLLSVPGAATSPPWAWGTGALRCPRSQDWGRAANRWPRAGLPAAPLGRGPWHAGHPPTGLRPRGRHGGASHHTGRFLDHSHHFKGALHRGSTGAWTPGGGGSGCPGHPRKPAPQLTSLPWTGGRRG